MVIVVRDTGGGIPPQIQARVFEPFFTTKSNGAGSGMGLAIVKRVVENHRGSVDLESEPGRGATFRVTLPRV